MKLRQFVFALLTLTLLTVSSPAMAEGYDSSLEDMSYGEGISRKLGRGIANTGLGWIEILKGIDETGRDTNFIGAITWGPIYGALRAIGRTAAGVYEIVTFPIPVPENFQPILHPEFVLDNSIDG